MKNRQIHPRTTWPEWRRQRQEWVEASWASHANGPGSDEEEKVDSQESDGGIEGVGSFQGDSTKAGTTAGRSRENAPEGGAEGAPVTGDLAPLVAEGESVMVCIGYALVKTRHGRKDYLHWRETIGSPVLNQFFSHYDRYPVRSKAVENYIVAMGERPIRLDRISFSGFIGLKATVYVETVKPTYPTGALKGRPKPDAMHYSKVSEILAPLGHVDANTLRKLRGLSLRPFAVGLYPISGFLLLLAGYFLLAVFILGPFTCFFSPSSDSKP